MRKELWQPALSGAVVDRDPLKNLPDIQTIIPKTEPDSSPDANVVAVELAATPDVHPMLREAVASLDEMLEAELSAETSKQEAEEEDSVHAAILAAFESKKEVETAVEDVSSTCDDLKELWDGELVAMPECTDWPDPMPVSRFGEGAINAENDNQSGSRFALSMPSKRMLASSGAILLFLTAASVAYFDFGASTDEQSATVAMVSDNSEKSLAAKETLVANAGKFTMPASAEPQLKLAPVVRQAVQTTGQIGVTQVEKNYFPPDPEVDTPIETVVARVEATENSTGPKSTNAGGQGNLSERFFGVEKPADTSLAAVADSPLQDAAPLPQPTRVKTVALVRNQPARSQTIRSKPSKRAEVTVKQAINNAKAIDTLTSGQRAQLLPRLIEGECVASALGKVAGRVSPVLMRDLLTSLDSDC